MTKYNQGKIYKITSPSSPKIYIGSTTNALCKRMAEHRQDAKRKFGGGQELIKFGDAIITLIKYAPCETKEELLRAQRECIDEHVMRGVLLTNKNSPANTSAELKIKKKEKFNCECGCKYTRQNVLRHLQSTSHQSYLQQKTDNFIGIDFITENPRFKKVSCLCGGKYRNDNNKIHT